MKYLLISTGLLAGLIGTPVSADGTQMICTPSPIVCTHFDMTTSDRFDPFVQHLLVRQQIQALPLAPQITNFYTRYDLDHRSLEEIQIRYMDELRRREATETKTADSAATDEPVTPNP